MCGKAFARKAEIRDHERTHTGEKPYQCEFCGATFSQRSNLQSHKRATHYDDKRYKCMECGKGFKRRRLLDYHMKAAHTGERPYKCGVCAATFIYPEHFKKHRRIHTGEKPFLCEVCGKAFNSRDNRNAHRFVHSDKKPYECLVCGMGFMRKPLLYNHMQTQGHLNDTIVVNQPRLTTDEDNILVAQTGGENLEMAFVTDSDGNTKLLHADGSVVRELDPGSQDTKMYIAELKEHVILHKEREDGIVEGDEIVEGAEYDETVQHLIIDGQTGVSDHYSTGLTITATATATVPHADNLAGDSTTQYYTDMHLLSRNLAHLNWEPVMSCQDIAPCAEQFARTISCLIKASSKPLIRHSTRKKKLKPWISPDLIKLIRIRDKISKKLKNNLLITIFIKFSARSDKI
ncbi:hypothetical protein J6590_086781 [Homalodisca vitripennis]|nr:hypothetical protein J6590_086781 [Homalodisca vitripennis]